MRLDALSTCFWMAIIRPEQFAAMRAKFDGLRILLPLEVAVNPRDKTRRPGGFACPGEGREVARRSKSNLAFFFAQLRVLRAFAVIFFGCGQSPRCAPSR
jgi:hypothetical protein